MKKIFAITLFITSITQSYAQGTFTYQPQHPKAGDEIKFSYMLPDSCFYVPEAYVVKYIKNREHLFDVPLRKKGNTYSGNVTTDTSVNLLVFSFKNADKWDNNSNKGFFVYLYNNNHVKKYAYSSTAVFFDFYGRYRLGLQRSDSAAVCNYEKEFSLYPENRDRFFSSYLRNLNKVDSFKAKVLADAEIDKMLKQGLKTSRDYQTIQWIYSDINLPEKADYYKKSRVEKIPYDKYNEDDLREILRKEKNISVKEKFLDEFITEKKDSSDKIKYSNLIDIVIINLANDYIENKNWNAFKNAMDNITPSWGIDFIYSKAAESAMLDSTTLNFARYFAKQAVIISNNDWKNPGIVPNDMTYKEFVQNLKTLYDYYSDRYAEILFKSKMYKEALPYAKEAALTIEEGSNIGYNSVYASVASKVLPVETYKPQLEKFVKEGNDDDNIISILKDAYVLQGNDSAKFNDYINKLKAEANAQLMKEIKSKKINSPSFPFELKDMKGRLARLKDYIGKIVVLDFWATWCGPCVASFPAMNDLVQQYKNDTSVVFLFINTFQHEEDRIKPATDFINKNKYNFNVLFDTESKISKLYDVNFIPAKIIIGKDGKINFKTVGFGGDALMKKEFNTMIELIK